MHIQVHIKVRGPVARVPGVIQLSKMESGMDFPSFQKIEEQAIEMDEVVKCFNKELQL